jgi:type II secretory pathway pseudopilin PulG
MNRITLKAFSLVELLTVIAIITLLVSLLMPALGRARELSRRTACSANLKAITQGLLVYAETNKGFFPTWGQRYAGFAAAGSYYDWDGGDGLSPSPNDSPCVSNTRCLWALVRAHMGDARTFLCTSDGLADAPFIPADMNNTYDIQNRSQMSYSYQWQGPGRDPGIRDDETNKARPGWITSIRDDNKLVVLADHTPFMMARNPAITARTDSKQTGSHVYDLVTSKPGNFGYMFVNALLALEVVVEDGVPFLYFPIPPRSPVPFASVADARQYVNSTNHRGEGQSYARIDGFVGFAESPWVGVHSDNIYTVQDPQGFTPSSSSGFPDVPLRARMMGLYDTTKIGENGILDNWVVNPLSKTKYPDSFLVP